MNICLIIDSSFLGLNRMKEAIHRVKDLEREDSLMCYFDALKNIREGLMMIPEGENTVLSEVEPWKLFSNGQEEIGRVVLFKATAALIIATFLLHSVMPSTTEKVLESFDINFTQIKYLWNSCESADVFAKKFLYLITSINLDNIRPTIAFMKIED